MDSCHAFVYQYRFSSLFSGLYTIVIKSRDLDVKHCFPARLQLINQQPRIFPLELAEILRSMCRSLSSILSQPSLIGSFMLICWLSIYLLSPSENFSPILHLYLQQCKISTSLGPVFLFYGESPQPFLFLFSLSLCFFHSPVAVIVYFYLIYQSFVASFQQRGGATGVCFVRGCQKLPPCLTESMPARSDRSAVVRSQGNQRWQ